MCERFFRVIASLLPVLLSATVLAQDSPTPIEDLQRRLAALEKELAKLRDEPASPPEQGIEVTPFWNRETLPTPPNLRGLYDRPFLLDLWRQAYVGGYSELEYHSFQNGILGIPEGFRMSRTNLFIFTELGDTLRFGAEIEFETEFEGGDPSSDIEVALEMAFVDWTLANELVFRGGVILPPLGHINVNHDGPVRDLTERPLVSTFVIPTTLSDAGVGLHGQIPANESLSFRYETYVVNGFNLLDANGNLSVPLTEIELLLREESDSIGGDRNDSVATTGRVSARAWQSLELGASWHVGEYDERADNLLTIVAADLSANVGRFSFEGEFANADFERDAFARSSGVPDRFWGYYVQGGLRLDGEELRPLAPLLFGEGSSLTFVTRYDFVDLDGDRGATIEPGIAFRPVADTVFKFSYRFSQYGIGLSNVPGREDWRDSGFVFSIATYF